MLFIRAESLQNYAFLTHMIVVGNQSEQSKQDGVQRQIFLANYALIIHAYHCNRYWCLSGVPVYGAMSRPATISTSLC